MRGAAAVRGAPTAVRGAPTAVRGAAAEPRPRWRADSSRAVDGPGSAPPAPAPQGSGRSRWSGAPPRARWRARSKAMRLHRAPSMRPPPCRQGPVRPGWSRPGSASARRAPRGRRRAEALRCRPCAARGRLGRPRSRRSGSSPRCPTPGRGRGPPCWSGRAHVPARRRVSSSARAPTVLLVRSGAGRETGSTHHPRTHGHRLRRTAHRFPAAYGGVRPLRALLRRATTGPVPGDAPPPRGIPGSPGTTMPHGRCRDRSPGLGRRPSTPGPAGPPPRSAGSRHKYGGGLCGALRFARLHRVDVLVGLLLLVRRLAGLVPRLLPGLVLGLRPGLVPGFLPRRHT